MSDDPLFAFSGRDITRMRVEIHNMLRSITEQYRSNRETSAGSLAASDIQDASVNLFADTDSDEEADDVDEDDVAFINSDHSSDDSGSEWSFGGDNESMMHDEDDEPLVYESTGKFCYMSIYYWLWLLLRLWLAVEDIFFVVSTKKILLGFLPRFRSKDDGTPVERLRHALSVA